MKNNINYKHQENYEFKMKENGFIRIKIWVHKEDENKLKEMGSKLREERK